MFYDNALSLTKQNLTISLATASVCLLNSSPAAAVNFDLETKSDREISRRHREQSHSFYDFQHHQEPGILSRIVTLFAAPLRTQIANLLPVTNHAEQSQKDLNLTGMGGSFGRDLTPIYLSQLNSSLAKDLKLAAIDSSTTQVKSVAYTVQAGDTINRIAKKYQVSREELIKVNKINNSNIIFVGQQLTIPATTSDNTGNKTVNYKAEVGFAATNIPTNSISSVRIADAKIDSRVNENFIGERDETLTSAVRQSDRELDSISTEISLELPPLAASEEYLPNAFDGYAWPAQGVLTSGYGWRWGRLHKGIDIAGPVGTPVLAAADGEVVSAGWNSGGYGNLIKIEHLDGSTTIYAHNHKIMVNKGQRVYKGEQIAQMGNTGFSTGSHLHFEIHSRERGIINPLALLD